MLPLDAFRSFLFQLLPDHLGQGLFLFARLGQVVDPVGGNLDLGLAVHALGGSFELILDLLVEVAAHAAHEALVNGGDLDSNILAIKSELDLLPFTLDLDDVVLGPEDMGNDGVPVKLGPDLAPLVGLDGQFLFINDDPLLALEGAGLGNDLDDGLAKDNLEFLAVTGLHVPGHDREALGLGAVSGQQVVAVIKVGGEGLVVKSLQSLGLQLADGEERVSGELLGDELDVVDSGLEGENLPDNGGQTDLPELELFLGPLDGHVKAGGPLVEDKADHDGGRPDAVFHVDTGTFFVDPSEGPQESLHGVDGHGFNVFNRPGNVVVPDGEFNFIQSGRLFADLFASRRQLGKDGLFGLLPFLQELATLGFLGNLGEFLLFVGNLGVTSDINVPLPGARLEDLEGVVEPEVDEAVADFGFFPDGQDGGFELASQDNALLGLFGLQIDVPLGLDPPFGRFLLLATDQGHEVFPGTGSGGAFQSGGQLESQSADGFEGLVQRFDSLDNLFLSFGVGPLFLDGFGFNGEGHELPQGLEDGGGGGDLLGFFNGFLFGDHLDLHVLDRFGLFSLGSISNLQLELDFLGGRLGRVELEGVFVPPDGGTALVIKSQVGEDKPEHVQGVVVVQRQLVEQGLEVVEAGFGADLGGHVKAEVFAEGLADLLELVPGFDHPLLRGQAGGSQRLNGLLGSEGVDVVVDHIEDLAELFEHLDLEDSELSRHVQFDLDFKRQLDDKGLIKGGGEVFLVEGVNHSDFADELDGVEDLGLKHGRGLPEAQVNLGHAFDGGDGGHAVVDDDGDTHVGGDQVLGLELFASSPEGNLPFLFNHFLDRLGILEDPDEFFLHLLGGHFGKVGEEGSGLHEVDKDSTAHLAGVTGLDVQLFDDLAPFRVQRAFDLPLHAFNLFFNRLAGLEGFDEFMKLVVKVFSALHPQTKSEGLEVVLAQEVPQFGVEFKGDEGGFRGNPVGHAFESSSEPFELLGGVEREGGGEDLPGLLDQGVSQTGLLAEGHDLADTLLGGPVFLRQSPQGGVDNLQDFLILFVPGPGSNLLEDIHSGVELEEDVESSDPHFSGLSGVGKDGVEDGFDGLGLDHAGGGQAPQSQKAGHPGDLGHVLNAAFDNGDQLADDLFMGQHAKGDNDLVLPVHVLGGFQFLQKVGDPLFLEDTAVGVAHFSHNPDRVLDITVLAQAGLFQEGGDGHHDNVPGEAAVLDPLGLGQFNELFKDLLGGEHQGVGQHVEEGDDVDLGQLSAFDLFLEEVDGFGGTSHDNGIKEQVLVLAKLGLDLLVDLLDFSLGEHGKSTGNGENLHGDLLFDGVVLNGPLQFFDQGLDKGLDLLHDLGLGDPLVSHHGDGGDGLGQLFGVLGNIPGDAVHLLHLFFLALDGFVGLERVFVHHVLQGGHVGGLGLGALRADFTEPQDLESASDNPLGVDARQVLVEFALVDDGLDHEVTTGSTSNVAGFGGPSPHILAVGSLAHVVAGVDEAEGGAPLAVVDVLGLDDFVVLVFLALLALGNQFGSVTDHVLGQFVDLVGDFAKAIDLLFLGLPEVTLLTELQKKKRYEIMSKYHPFEMYRPGEPNWDV